MIAHRFLKDPAQRIAKTVFRKYIRDIILQDKDKICNAIMTGSAGNNAGSRIWPTRNRDKEVGIRFDWGSGATPNPQTGLHTRDFNLQINKDSKYGVLAEAAEKSSHEKRVTFILETTAAGKVKLSEEKLLEYILKVVDEMKDTGL